MVSMRRRLPIYRAECVSSNRVTPTTHLCCRRGCGTATSGARSRKRNPGRNDHFCCKRSGICEQDAHDARTIARRSRSPNSSVSDSYSRVHRRRNGRLVYGVRWNDRLLPRCSRNLDQVMRDFHGRVPGSRSCEPAHRHPSTAAKDFVDLHEIWNAPSNRYYYNAPNAAEFNAFLPLFDAVEHAFPAVTPRGGSQRGRPH